MSTDIPARRAKGAGHIPANLQPEQSVFPGCSKIFDLVVLSALWLALCLPVVTIGPATAALYYTVVKCIRRGEAEPLQNFFRSFRGHFKVGAVSGVIAAAVGVVLWVGWMMFNLANPEDAGVAFMRTVYTVVLVIPLGVAVYPLPGALPVHLRGGGLLRRLLQAGLQASALHRRRGAAQCGDGEPEPEVHGAAVRDSGADRPADLSLLERIFQEVYAWPGAPGRRNPCRPTHPWRIPLRNRTAGGGAALVPEISGSQDCARTCGGAAMDARAPLLRARCKQNFLKIHLKE